MKQRGSGDLTGAAQSGFTEEIAIMLNNPKMFEFTQKYAKDLSRIPVWFFYKKAAHFVWPFLFFYKSGINTTKGVRKNKYPYRTRQRGVRQIWKNTIQY